MISLRTEHVPCDICNVHLEPELCERLRRILDVWSTYLEGLGMIFGDFNMRQQEEGRFNLVAQTFREGDPGRTATF